VSITRSRALDAAVELIGDEGLRALTHGRVDTAAGLPPGSTSNHFRTRAALVSGVVEWIASQERSDAAAPTIQSPEELILALTRMIELQSGPLIRRTRARYALFLDVDPEVAAPLHAQRAGFESWIRGFLTELAGPDAARRAPFLMAACDGLLLHRITVDPEAEIAEAIRLAVTTALHG